MAAMMETIKGMGANKLAMIAGGGLAVLVLFGFLSFRLTAPVMTPLYSNLPVEDGAQLVAKLDAMKVRYELRAEGTQILVPADQVLKLRMAMAQESLPSRGSVVGYEIFDHTQALGTSNFVYNVNLIRALEGELSRTVGSFNQIEKARVHLVLPKRELFAKNQNPPTASVVLKLRGNQKIAKEQIAAIQHLVATAVPGLELRRITVVDSNGKLLAKGGDNPDDPSSMASTAQELKISAENRLKTMVEDLLEQSVGLGNVKAQISAEMDFDRVTTSSETFDPESRVARSVQTMEEIEKSSERDMEVSVANNLPPAEAGRGQGGSNTDISKTNETTNFEISKVVRNQVSEVGGIKRLSVAVLVDGVYTIDEKTGERTYAPRPQEELDKLTALVRSAVGFDEKRGDTVEVVNMQFTKEIDYSLTEKPFEWIKRDFDSILRTVVIGVIAILIILLVIRPLVHRAFEIAPAEEDALAASMAAAGEFGQMEGGAYGEQEGVDLEQLRGGASTSAIKRVNDFISNNPEESLAVIRGFMQKAA